MSGRALRDESRYGPTNKPLLPDPLNPHNVRVVDEADEAEFYAECYLADSPQGKGGCAGFSLGLMALMALGQQKLSAVDLWWVL